MSISEHVLNKIEEKKITPVARWKFVVRNVALWIFGIVMTLVGALAVAIFLQSIVRGDWDIYEYFGRTLFQHVTATFPYVWLVAIIAFLSLAYLLVRSTKTGYRYATLAFIGLMVVASMVLGALLFALNVGSTIDDALLRYVPAYAKLPQSKTWIWNSPGAGLLEGQITELVNDSAFTIRDNMRHEWLILEDDTDWRKSGLRTVGTMVKLLGTYENESVFIAEEVRPWN